MHLYVKRIVSAGLLMILILTGCANSDSAMDKAEPIIDVGDDYFLIFDSYEDYATFLGSDQSNKLPSNFIHADTLSHFGTFCRFNCPGYDSPIYLQDTYDYYLYTLSDEDGHQYMVSVTHDPGPDFFLQVYPTGVNLADMQTVITTQKCNYKYGDLVYKYDQHGTLHRICYYTEDILITVNLKCSCTPDTTALAPFINIEDKSAEELEAIFLNADS